MEESPDAKDSQLASRVRLLVELKHIYNQRDLTKRIVAQYIARLGKLVSELRFLHLERVAYYAGLEGTLIGTCSELLQRLLFPPFWFGFYCECELERWFCFSL